MSSARRLGNNINGYAGETINIQSVLEDCVVAARTHGWAIEELPAAPKPNLLAFTRPAPLLRSVPTLHGAHQGENNGELSPRNQPSIASAAQDHALVSPKSDGGGSRITHHDLRVYVSTGIHGDEPAGPLAMRQLLQDNGWPAGLDLWVCPCLNPTGFALNRRENDEGTDLNRQYLQPQARETLAHIAWLERQPEFDLCLCLHEDWESQGFYVYELNPDGCPSLAEPIVRSVAEVCEIDPSEMIEGRPAKDGIIRPSVDPRSRPQWPEAFFLITHKTRLSYTLEAPSDFPLPTRVAALSSGVRAALECLVASSSDTRHDAP